MESKFQAGFWVIPLMVFGHGLTIGQTPDFLSFRNHSFDAPTKYFVIPPAWSPQIIFLAGKKVKELSLSRFYRKDEKSQDGSTHVALSTTAEGVRENIGQQLRYPIIPGHRYKMEIWLAWSPVRTSVHPAQHLAQSENELRPIKLQVFGFQSDKEFFNSLLAETPLVDHRDWKKYTLEWESPGWYQNIYLVATCYGDEYYDGNLLLDNISDIAVSRIPVIK